MNGLSCRIWLQLVWNLLCGFYYLFLDEINLLFRWGCPNLYTEGHTLSFLNYLHHQNTVLVKGARGHKIILSYILSFSPGWKHYYKWVFHHSVYTTVKETESRRYEPSLKSSHLNVTSTERLYHSRTLTGRGCQCMSDPSPILTPTLGELQIPQSSKFDFNRNVGMRIIPRGPYKLTKLFK